MKEGNIIPRLLVNKEIVFTTTDMFRRDYSKLAGVIILSGTAGCSIINDSQPKNSSTRTKQKSTPQSQFSEFKIVLNGAPNGIRKYSIRLDVSPVAFVSLNPKLISGMQFRIVEGGESHSIAVIQGVDLARLVGSFTETKTLITGRLTSEITREDVEIKINTLVADNGNQISTDRVELRTI